MLKVIQRYNIRFLNHNGDYISLILTIALITVFVTIRYGYTFDTIGPPIANFEPVIPKGAAIYSYYGVNNPK